MSSFKAKKQAREQRTALAGPSRVRQETQGVAAPAMELDEPSEAAAPAAPAFEPPAAAAASPQQPPAPPSESSSPEPYKLSQNASLEVRHSAERGRSVHWAGAQPCPKGSTLLRLEPHVSALSSLHLSTHCYRCFVSSGTALQRCSGCQVVRYCGATCQRADWALHRAECASLKAYAAAAAKAKRAEGMEQEAMFEPGTSVRALARLLWTREKKSQEWWAQIQGMQSHRSTMTQSQLHPHADLAFHLSQYLSLSTGAPSAEALQQLGIRSPAELLDLVCSMATNSFTAAASDLSPLGVSVAPTAALVNHSCRPNAVVVFPKGPRSTAVKDGEEAMHLVAIRDIKPGEEILTAYVDLSDSLTRRQSTLRQGYFFTCDCAACAGVQRAELNWVDPREAVWCAKKACDGWVTQPRLERKERKCRKCGTEATMSCEEYDALVSVGEEALKAEQTASDPATAWALLRPAISHLSVRLPPSSYPLLSLLRAGQTALIGSASDAARPVSAAASAAMLEEATRLGMVCAAAMQSGAGAVYAPGHPARAVAMATLGKLLLLDRPTDEKGNPASLPPIEESAVARPPDLPPHGLQRVLLVRQVLVQAMEELRIGFGEEGGEVGAQTRGMLLELEREFDRYKPRS